MATATVNGVTLDYRELGSSTTPPLVLLHGRTANHNDWNGVVRPLAERFHVYAVSMRGHGDSAWPGHYAFQEMADDIAGLLDLMGVEQAAVVGHSLGGVVAYFLAATHPSRVGRLVLEDPPPPLPHPHRPPLVPSEEWTGFDHAMMFATEEQFVRSDPAWPGLLKQITAPTLVLSGGSASHVDSPAVADLIPGAQLVTIEVGHLIHFDDPDGFLREVLRFLEA